MVFSSSEDRLTNERNPRDISTSIPTLAKSSDCLAVVKSHNHPGSCFSRRLQPLGYVAADTVSSFRLLGDHIRFLLEVLWLFVLM